MKIRLLSEEGGRQIWTSGSSFEKSVSYARLIVDGDWCFVAGTTGYNYETMAIAPGGAAAQTRQALDNISFALTQAGFSLKDAVRLTTIVTSRDDVAEVTGVLGEVMKPVQAPNTLLIADLLNDDMKVEIEVTAKRRSGQTVP